MYIYIYIKLKEKILFSGLIIKLFQVYGDPLQMKTDYSRVFVYNFHCIRQEDDIFLNYLILLFFY